jgi:saxitoxin biosynthesis operon SxtJ-like protein
VIDPQLIEEAPAITNRTLRQFAGLLVVVFGAIVAWRLWRHPGMTVGTWLGGVAILTGFVGLVQPAWMRPIFATLVALTSPIGRIVSFLILSLLFYLIFTPLGFLFRLFGRDSLGVRLSERASHWTRREAVKDLRDYVRQS